VSLTSVERRNFVSNTVAASHGLSAIAVTFSWYRLGLGITGGSSMCLKSETETHRLFTTQLNPTYQLLAGPPTQPTAVSMTCVNGGGTAGFGGQLTPNVRGGGKSYIFFLTPQYSVAGCNIDLVIVSVRR